MTPAPPDVADWGFPNQATPVGSAAYYAVRFSPEPLRRRNALLFAWYQVIQDVTGNRRDPGAARLKLDWWRQEVTNIPRGEVKHPLAIALQASGIMEIAVPVMTAMIDCADEEIHAGSPANEEAFVSNCRGGMGNLFRLLAQLENRTDIPVEACLGTGGYCAAVERIRCLSGSPHRLPRDLAPERRQQLGPSGWTERIEAVLSRLHAETGPDADRLPGFARRLAALSRAMHSRMRRLGYPVTEPAVNRAPIADLWTAWRCR